MTSEYSVFKEDSLVAVANPLRHCCAVQEWEEDLASRHLSAKFGGGMENKSYSLEFNF